MPHPSPLLLLAKHFAEGKIDAESFVVMGTAQRCPAHRGLSSVGFAAVWPSGANKAA